MIRLPLRALLVLPLLPAIVAAEDPDDGGLYWRIGMGIGNADDASTLLGGEITYDEGLVLSGAVGWDFGKIVQDRFSLGIEAEWLRTEFDVTSDNLLALGSSTGESLTANVVFANAVLDWYWSPRISAYVAGGVGIANGVDFDTVGDGPVGSEYNFVDDTLTAVQGKAGLRYQLGGGLEWQLGYRFVSFEDATLSDPTIGSQFNLETTVHAVELGVSWSH